ncbi:uncharacterized protein Dvir_GJ26582 [Drosophila virilis]|uniref:Uncharacterized protein n=1 Tax=Drosophila virilis TaxID=7244 RepID=A0A0Q9WJZ5_DROVI|nr:uncharacterized protein Dvir_GJ26582 [Drosophila virilis]
MSVEQRSVDKRTLKKNEYNQMQKPQKHPACNCTGYKHANILNADENLTPADGEEAAQKRRQKIPTTKKINQGITAKKLRKILNVIRFLPKT